MAETKKKLRMLWLNDEKAFQEFIDAFLETAGKKDCLNIEWVGDGDAAMIILKTNPPDIFATDVYHPGASIGELLEHVAANRPGIPVCWVSGDCHCTEPEEFPTLQFFCLQCPFKPESLLSMVEQAMAAAIQNR